MSVRSDSDSFSSFDQTGDPIELVSAFVSRQDWYLHRTSRDCVRAEVPGRWGQYQLQVNWQPESEALMVRCHLELSLEEGVAEQMALLLGRLNQSLWLGHFSLDEQLGVIALRHTLTLRGAGGATPEQVEDVVDILLGQAEQAFPIIYRQAFGHDVSEGAAELVLMPVAGEA